MREGRGDGGALGRAARTAARVQQRDATFFRTGIREEEGGGWYSTRRAARFFYPKEKRKKRNANKCSAQCAE